MIDNQEGKERECHVTVKTRAGKRRRTYLLAFFLNFNIENKNREPLNVFGETVLMYCDNCHEGNNRSIKTCSY